MTQFEDDEAFLTGGDDGDVGRGEAPVGRRPGGKPHRGALILVLGILGLVFCPLTAPFAWMMGSEDLRQMRAGRMDPEGEGLTQAGRVLGMIVTGLMLLFVIGVVFVTCGTIVAGGSASSGYGG